MSGEGLVGNENTIVSRQKSILHDMVLFNMLKSHLKTIFFRRSYQTLLLFVGSLQ